MASTSFLIVSVSALLATSACRRAKPGPTLLQSPATNSAVQPWTSVSLTVAGPEINENKMESCTEEAQKAGIQLAAGAPIVGTLYFLEENDYLETAGAPNGRYTFGSMNSNATCKIALSKMTKLDTLVKFSKAEPSNCKATGSVEGSDSGFFHAGNYDAAVVEAQFGVRAAGGNLFVQDSSREQGNRVVVNGRGFHCAE